MHTRRPTFKPMRNRLHIVSSLVLLGSFAACSSNPPRNQQAGQLATTDVAEAHRQAEENLNFEFLQAIAQGRSDDARILLKRGADPNARLPGSRRENGPTALMLAAMRGDVAVVTDLLRKGARLNETDQRGGDALKAAASSGALRVAKLLLQAGANPATQNSEGYDALSLSVVGGFEDLVRELIRAHAPVRGGAAHDGGPVSLAVIAGNPRILKMVLDAGGDPNTRNPSTGGTTPLMSAATRGDEPIARLLLQSGARVDQQESSGKSALIFAAASGHFNIVSLLLKNGADPELRDHGGQTASDIARAVGSTDIATLLESRTQASGSQS